LLQLQYPKIARGMRDFYSPPFYSPSLIELERGNNSKKIIRIAPLFFKREGKGVSCVRDAEGGGERSEPPALPRLRLRWSLRWAKPEAISYW